MMKGVFQTFQFKSPQISFNFMYYDHFTKKIKNTPVEYKYEGLSYTIPTCQTKQLAKHRGNNSITFRFCLCPSIFAAALIDFFLVFKFPIITK